MTASRPTRFAFAADPHVESETTRDWLAEDLRRIRDVDFIVMGGDLTWSGSLQELGWYCQALSHASAPVYSVFGGHDGNELLFAGKQDASANFRRVLGSPWFAFEAGHGCGIGWIPPLDYATPGELEYLTPQQRQEQDAWLTATLQSLPAGRPLLLFQHMPTCAPLPAALLERPPAAVFMAHWHLLKAWQQNGTLYAAVPPLCVAGYSGIPRGYFLCELNNSEVSITYKTLDSRTVSTPQAGDPAEVGGATPPLRIAWQAEGDSLPFRSGAACAQDRVFLAANHPDALGSTLAARDARTGNLLWQQTLPAPVFQTPLVAGSRLLSLAVNGTLHALDAASGERLWQAAIDSGPGRWALGSFTASEQHAFLRTPQRVAALDLEDGRLLWQAPFRHHDWMGASAAPLLDGSRLFVQAVLGEGVTCFDARSGEVCWASPQDDWLQRPGGGLALHADKEILYALALSVPMPGAPQTTEEGRKGFVYGGLIAFSAREGRILWRKPIGSHNYSAPLVAGEDLYLSDTVSGRLLALDADSGEERWAFQSGPPLQCISGNRRSVPGIASAPQVSGACVLAGAADGHLYVLHRRNGAPAASLALPAAIHAAPALHGGHIYLPDSSGSLYCIETSLPEMEA